MKSDNRNNSAIIAFPLDTSLKIVCPQRLFSAKKSTIVFDEQQVYYRDRLWNNLKTSLQNKNYCH